MSPPLPKILVSRSVVTCGEEVGLRRVLLSSRLFCLLVESRLRFFGEDVVRQACSLAAFRIGFPSHFRVRSVDEDGFL
jgi:hypothetical protein